MPTSPRPSRLLTAAIQRDEKRREQEKRLADLKAHFSSLTSREREIMALVASGLMSKQIAAQVGLSEITVKVHRSHIMKKMEAVLVELLKDKVNADAALVRRGRFVTTTFLIEVGSAQWDTPEVVRFLEKIAGAPPLAR